MGGRETKATTPDPLTGLRGLASLHVMLFHYFLHSRNLLMILGGTHVYSKIHLQGSIEMPMFFILSGFSLSLGYGSSKGRMGGGGGGGSGNRLKYGRYFRNRFARIAPIYYLSQVAFLPAYFHTQHPSIRHGPTTFWKTVLFTATCTNTWFSPWVNLPFYLPAWTINTFFFFYLTFPFLLSRLERLSDIQLANLVVYLFWLQLIPFGILLSIFPEYFWPLTANPLSRLPVFVMGIIAGLQNLREKDEDYGFVDPNLHQSILHCLFPWGLHENYKRLPLHESQANNRKYEAQIWRRRVDLSTLIIILLMAIATIASSLWGDQWKALSYDSHLRVLSKLWIPVNDLGQLYLVHLHLIIIVGLTRDQGSSFLSRICRTDICQYLGLISMTLYLIHYDIPLYLMWAVYPDASYSSADCHQLSLNSSFSSVVADLEIIGNNSCLQFFALRQTLPNWGIALLCLAVPSLAWLIYNFIEEPARKVLRAPRNNTSSRIIVKSGAVKEIEHIVPLLSNESQTDDLVAAAIARNLDEKLKT